MRLCIITATLGAHETYLKQCAESVQKVISKCAGNHVVITQAHRVEAVSRWLPKSVVLPEPSKGLYPSINAGISFAIKNYTATAFTYINDDDGLIPDGFAGAINQFEAFKGAVGVYGRVRYVDANGSSLGEASICRHSRDLIKLFANGIPALTQQGTIFPVSWFLNHGPFDETLRLAADGEWIVRMLSHGNRFAFHNDCVAFYRCRPGQLSDDVAEMVRESERVRLRASEIAGEKWRRLFAVVRYRLLNIPTMVKRMRASGFQSTRSMFCEKRVLK